MKIIRNSIILILLVLLLAGGGYYLYRHFMEAPEVSRVKVEKSKIRDISPMLQLCTVEIYDEIPVKGRAGKKHLVAKTVIYGSISFDLENVQIIETADTIDVTLPSEIIQIQESTEPGAYQVIDTWSDGFLDFGTLTTRQENKIKKLVLEGYRKSLYDKGLVRKARKEAARNLASLLRSATGKTVIVTDFHPNGVYTN